MPRVYTVAFIGQAVTTAVDLFEITPATNKPVRLLGMVLGEYTDYGDIQAEQLGLQILRGGTAGSGGGSPAKAPIDGVDTAAGFAAATVNTTLGGGSPTLIWADVWNEQVGYQIWWPEGCQPESNATLGPIQIRMTGSAGGTAPTDSITLNGTLVVQEV